MSGPRPKSPGWYPDPDILPESRQVLRYWNGHQWTDRRRPAPVLTNLRLGVTMGAPLPNALEGPARPVEQPARAAEVSASREGPGGRADTLDRPPVPETLDIDLAVATGGDRGGPPRPPRVGGGGSGGGGQGGDGDSPRRTFSRRRWWLLGGLALLCAVAVTLAFEAVAPLSPGKRVLSDANFVKQANALCAKTIPGLRPADGGPFGSFVSPTQTADGIDRAATGLDNLANQLAALPAAAPDRSYIAEWLGQWRQFDNQGRQYAASLRIHGTTVKQPTVLNAAAHAAQKADNFSTANGLKSCLFTYVDTSGASDF